MLQDNLVKEAMLLDFTKRYFRLLLLYSFPIQCALESEATRVERVFDLVMCSQNELVYNAKIHETLGNSEHNQLLISV